MTSRHPCGKLYLYGIAGCPDITDCQLSFDDTYIGAIDDDGLSVLVFSHPAAGLVHSLLSTSDALSLVYEAESDYSDWECGVPFTTTQVARWRIVPEWERGTIPAEPMDIVIDPGLSFGTGLHPATRLALNAISMLPPAIAKGGAVVDFGCGSGVLSFAALRSGASRATGIDLSPHACMAANHNAEANCLGARFKFVQADAMRHLSIPGGIVLCNISFGISMRIIGAPQFRAAQRQAIIVSGIHTDHLAEQAADMITAVYGNDVIHAEESNWHCFTILP